MEAFYTRYIKSSLDCAPSWIWKWAVMGPQNVSEPTKRASIFAIMMMLRANFIEFIKNSVMTDRECSMAFHWVTHSYLEEFIVFFIPITFDGRSLSWVGQMRIVLIKVLQIV